MLNLVFYTDNTLKAEPYTTPEIIANNTGNNLDNVNRLIRNKKSSLERFGVLEFEIRKPLKTLKVAFQILPFKSLAF
ncbi:hypothetical protein [Ligilactobacillus salivarius]|uniref:hypothetical protein n=1 Tax=Ligilactobacillus salivarius TaxID=1624 RepID=UPI0039968B11